MLGRTDAVTKQVSVSGSYTGCFPLRKMVNNDMNGFPVKKCSAFQFFKKRVRRWIKKPSSSKDKHQNKHLKTTPGSTVMHITPMPEESECLSCQSYLDGHSFDSFTTSQDSQMHYWESQRSCSTVMKSCKKEALSPLDQKTFWSSNDSGKI
ncbi:uncharacterized protein LOC143803916 [Ranitomeya variabilis]|uniref:uncharacterized protein LOC143803916 n=1 Tax=Ranitomeya variabilis TaxID=490064 RepID=UPI004056AAE2